jgi:hypothetical protein
MDVCDAFRAEGLELDAAAAEECERICSEALITPEDLVCKWEAWAMSRGRGVAVPSADDLRNLAGELARRGKNDAGRGNLRGPNAEDRQSRNGGLKQRAASSLVRRVGPLPPLLTVNDFFTYMDDPEDGTDPLGLEPLVVDPIAAPPVDSLDLDMKDRFLRPLAVEKDSTDRGASFTNVDEVVLPGDDDLATRETYASRSDAGRVLVTYNSTPTLGSHANAEVCDPGAVNVSLARKESRPFTYMNDELDGAVETVRERVRWLGERLLARRSACAPETSLPDVTPNVFFGDGVSKAGGLVAAMGRIRLDSDGSDCSLAAINESSVLLESEDGNLLKLSLARLKESKRPVFITPGMVVIVEGNLVPARTIPALRNKAVGTVFEVSSIYDNAFPLLAPSSGDDNHPHIEQTAFPTARIVVAAGPYTLPGNLAYEPLTDLLERALRSKSSAVVLFGPFVDENHKLVNEQLTLSFDKLFETRVMAKILAAAAERPTTRFLIVPALADVHHHYVCPQPQFAGFDLPPNVHFVPNPASCVVSNPEGTHCALIGMTSLPTIKDISGNCICLGTRDRFGAIVACMIRQCSYYPFFPSTPAVPLDCTLLELLDIPESGVDALLAPSLLMPFVKCVETDVLTVNPGILVRGPGGGGSYAEVVVPLTREAGNPARRITPGASGSRPIERFSRAEIYRM